MGKHKIDINKNSLSWEKTFFRKCDKNDCNNEGKFKAPKSRVLLNQYYYFCLEHTICFEPICDSAFENNMFSKIN